MEEWLKNEDLFFTVVAICYVGSWIAINFGLIKAFPMRKIVYEKKAP